MVYYSILENYTNFPEAGNETRANTLLAEWLKVAEKDIGDFADSLASTPEGRKLLKAIFGNSPYLSRTLMRESGFFKFICENGFDISFATLMANMEEDTSGFETTDAIMSYLRKTKLRVSLLIATADITEEWGLEEVTQKLSEFAELCLKISAHHLLCEAHIKGDIEFEDVRNVEENSGLIILAMGKLGARELNYSSDIDIIVFFDEKKVKYTGRTNVSRFFVQLTRELSRIMDQRTHDGYVFRTDLRLRPDPGSTPVAISVRAAEHYYENLGQNWERAAMIKARPIAGDKNAGNEFMKFMIPYVWRRSLDFDSIEDIHSIKRQIDTKHGELPDNLYGYNIKLGRGGIREIEFFAQTQQLIWGGRRPILQISPTCKALKALVESGELVPEVCDELIAAYRFYRKIEHRLQMIEDQQTHSLPDSAEKMLELAIFLGYRNTEDFITELSDTINRTQWHYGDLFKDAPSLASESVGGNLVFTGSDNDPSTIETLKKMGFNRCETISEIIRGWHHGRYRATRTKRARELLTKLMPVILNALAKTVNSDIAFHKFDEFLNRLPSGVQIFSLFYVNPRLMDLIAEIMGGYPYIANNLSRSPALLDYVLAPEFYSTIPNNKTLFDGLNTLLNTQARDFQDILNLARLWTHDREFRIGIQLVKHSITTEEANENLSNIADIVINVLLERIVVDFEEKHGKIAEGEFAIVALGKLGSRELTFASDLDLVFIYDTKDKVALSDGKSPLSASRYFARLSRRFTAAITALTKEGCLYDVDLRLRPSGNDGPIAISLMAFDMYYGSSAWAWEYMALTRARVISGSQSFKKNILDTINKKLCSEWNSNELAGWVINMRNRVEKERCSTSPFDVKYARGGLMDIEYIAQFIQIRYASEYEDILDTNIKAAFTKFYKAEIIDRETHKNLTDACRFYHTVQTVFRLIGDEYPKEDKMTDGMKRTIIHHLDKQADIRDFASFKKTLIETQKNIQKIFACTIK